MSIVFYSAAMSSATPVASALRELDVPHERVTIDLSTGAQRSPEHLARNPNGKVPTLVVDGTPMFEALAIMQWLGDRYGVRRGLWPAPDAPARLTALSWTTWAYVTYGAALQRLNVAQSERAPSQLRSAVHAEHAMGDLRQLLGILDGWLASRPYLLGQDFSLADLIVSSVVNYGTFCGAPTEPYPHVNAWIGRVQARPAIRAEWS